VLPLVFKYKCLGLGANLGNLPAAAVWVQYLYNSFQVAGYNTVPANSIWSSEVGYGAVSWIPVPVPLHQRKLTAGRRSWVESTILWVGVKQRFVIREARPNVK